MSNATPLYYDLFISHNHANGDWAGLLADRLAASSYNGRPLRPWLDRQYLDPGELSGNSELTTALDRSRLLGLVLSPAALASEWVDFEIDYFLQQRSADDVILMMLEDCELPERLKGMTLLDFRQAGEFEARFEAALEMICPATREGLDDVASLVDGAMDACVHSDPGGFATGTSKERDAVFSALQQFPIDDGRTEGLAVAAYERAAKHLIELHEGGDDRAYNTKMLLGECLAAALADSPAYRQVAQRFIDISAERTGDPVLLFVIARAYSKLGDIDAQHVDTSVVLRVASALDASKVVSNEQKAIETLIGRIVGKLRATPAGDLLIKTMIEAGRSSRIAAILGISLNYKRGGPVFYLSSLERLHEQQSAEELHLAPPSKRMLALLFASDLDQHPDVTAALTLAKQDIEHDFPGTDFPYGYSWLGLRPEIPVTHSHLGSFIGSVVSVTLDNMIDVGQSHDKVSAIAAFNEPRIIEALFQNCGALLVPEQDPDSHQCQRLRGRGIPFAMVSEKTMSLCNDGDVVVAHDGELRIWSREHEPDWPGD